MSTSWSSPTRIWITFAGSTRSSTAVRDLLAAWLERAEPKADGRFATLFALHDAIERRIKRGDIEVAFGGVLAPRPWTGRADAYRVENFAPTTYDAERMGRQINDALLKLSRDGIEPTERLLAFLRGERQWSDDPNVVSLALAITWGQTRLIFGGDVLTGTSNHNSGWKGIIRWLAGGSRRPDRRGMLRDPTLVKVAHHGSTTGFSTAAWDLHTTSGPVPLALIMPFDRHALPDAETLDALRARSARLALTSCAQVGARIESAGWAPADGRRIRADVPLVAIELDAEGTVCAVALGGDAALYRCVADAVDDGAPDGDDTDSASVDASPNVEDPGSGPDGLAAPDPGTDGDHM